MEEEIQLDPFDRGYVHVYTGNGKGKTTAALGLALRAVGAGYPVFIGQFIKSERYSEVEVLERFVPELDCRQFGRGCWLRGEPSRQDIDLAQQAMMTIREILCSERYRVVVLDELVTALYFKLVDLSQVLDLLAAKPENVELILTGRYAPEALIAAADLVTEMREVKHYYEQGVLARKGIEC
jgi:cob(I)alamin adenosyltransferase